MKKRFDIRLALEQGESQDPQVTEAPLLEVEKEAAMTTEEKEIRDKALQTEADEKAKAEETPTLTEAPLNTDLVDNPVIKEAKEEIKEDLTGIPVVTQAPIMVEPAPVIDPETLEDNGIDPESDQAKELENVDDKIDRDLDNAVEAVVSLEKLRDVLQRSLDTGGMSVTAAKATSVCLENIYTTVGLKKSNTSYPALESFNSSSARKVNTKLAIEGIGQSIDRIWQAISSAINRVASRLKDKLGSLSFALKSYANQIKAIKLVISKAKRDKPNLAFKFTNKNAIGMLSSKGVFNPTNSFVQMKDTLHGIRTVTLPHALTLVSNFKEIALADFKTNKVYPAGLTAQSSGDALNTIYKSSKSLPGDTNIIVRLPNNNLNEQNHLDSLKRVNVEILYSLDNANIQPDFLDKNQFDQYLRNLEALLAELIATDKVLFNISSSLDKTIDKFNTKTGMIIGGVMSGVIGAAILAIPGIAAGHYISKMNKTELERHILISLKAINSIYISLPFEICSLSSDVISSGISYANNSAKAYL